MSSQTTTHAAKAPAKGAAKASSGTYISLMALVMMNVTIIGSVANDVQQAYYGLSSVTLFIIGALVFFLPTGLVAAELASGWGQRGGIFRWVGEAMGPGLAFTCLLILWFQTSINFGMGVASASATIGFYTPDWDWAVQFMNHPENQFFIILAWLAYYWGLTFLSTKGVKAFARLTKYGVIIARSSRWRSSSSSRWYGSPRATCPMRLPRPRRSIPSLMASASLTWPWPPACSSASPASI